MGSVHVTAHRLWKAVAFAAVLWVIQSSPAAADDRLLADLNGDGRTDQVTIVRGPYGQSIRLTFSGGAVTWLRTPHPLRQIVARDLNRDGSVDLVAITESFEIVAWLNRGNGRFTKPRLPHKPHRAPPGPIASASRAVATDAYSIGSDPDNAIVRIQPVVAAPVPRTSVHYSEPIVAETSTTPSRPRGPPSLTFSTAVRF